MGRAEIPPAPGESNAERTEGLSLHHLVERGEELGEVDERVGVAFEEAARAAAVPTFEALVESLRATQAVVHRAFDEIIADPAAAFAATKNKENET